MNLFLSASPFAGNSSALVYFFFFFFHLMNMSPAVRAFVGTASPRSMVMRKMNIHKQTFSRLTLRPPSCDFPARNAVEQRSDHHLLICRAVSDLGEDGRNNNAPSPDQAFNTPPTNKGGGLSTGSWLQKRGLLGKTTTINVKESLLKVSNVASLLCVLDCTILPVITIVLPLFGIVAASPAQMEYLHQLGHSLALWFVLPVGGMATTLNYTNHGKLWIATMGWTGLLAVLAANAGCVHLPFGGHLLHHVLHVLHHGVIHRITNLAGCALLLSSNYLSHKQGGCRDPTCTHSH